ncbi:hypothetical protein Desdi_2355 [Desulfitobacterium dichloroeliminans LMG P-21439]|uniref:Uncharacterized protein n=1 Tax=Desulfitobacterium dichloroeliminans (strain LMG P-21439 / DCA1) TaxID=871963 RepID=L0F7F9_DESDL|nr:hypothetical protein [Desulfitobacterium dichloroeliminans]AGA69779.1 hypothetical protein Desdi_2355 [Desulfitobacterium dichloroeliminans LMG P-21439]
MELDEKTTLLVKISAAAATNALASLRSSMTDAKALGVPHEILRQTVELALEIQQQPYSHTQHLTDQLLREPVKKKTAREDGATPSLHVNGPSCGCGHHHHNN